jgi:hypothetical protein
MVLHGCLGNKALPAPVISKKSCFASSFVLYSKDHKVGFNSQPRLVKPAPPSAEATPATRQALIFLHAPQASITGKSSI